MQCTKALKTTPELSYVLGCYNRSTRRHHLGRAQTRGPRRPEPPLFSPSHCPHPTARPLTFSPLAEPQERSNSSRSPHDDEDISTIFPLITEDDDAKIQDTNEIRIGPIRRARAKLLNQQVKSFLVGFGILLNENFILPKSLHLCLIRFEEGYGVEGEEAKL
jgi:hypothetical protein